MGEKMTLRESVLSIPTREELLGGQRYKYVRLEEVLGAIDAHLTQSAQAVDVGALEPMIRELCEWPKDETFYDHRATRLACAEKLRALGNAQAEGWRPIETAPKDGTRVLLAFDGRTPTCGSWNDDRYSKTPRPYWSTDNERIVGRSWLRSNPPIKWLPLPTPPQLEE